MGSHGCAVLSEPHSFGASMLSSGRQIWLVSGPCHRMKFLPLIWFGIWRKPGRTVLIFLQACVAFALFGVLQGLKTGVEHVVSEARADLLLVHGSLSLIDPLPLGLLEGIKSVPGVKVVAPVDLTVAIYREPSQKVGVVAIRPDSGWLSAFTYTISPEYREAC